jgi:hypothetical protein
VEEPEENTGFDEQAVCGRGRAHIKRAHVADFGDSLGSEAVQETIKEVNANGEI